MATRLTQPLVIDGRLDEAVYRTIEPAPKFLQQEPKVGEPATEQTEMWVFFDDRNVYVSAWMHDSEPDRLVANEMRRDGGNMYQNDNFSVVHGEVPRYRSWCWPVYANAVPGITAPAAAR